MPNMLYGYDFETQYGRWIDGNWIAEEIDKDILKLINGYNGYIITATQLSKEERINKNPNYKQIDWNEK